MNDFHEDLKFSHDQSDQPWWEDVYRQAFPTFAAMTDVRGDGWWQPAGIDRVVTLASSKQILIDEKVRRKDWGDILLEYWSSVEHQTRGWIAKDLACDYIAYAFKPSATCHLLPFQLLRRVWKLHRHDWVDRYGECDAKNDGYTTRSCPVPTTILLDALRDAMTITWERQTA